MLVAYLRGQRPTDVRLFDISKDHLYIGQDKTEKKLRIKLNIDNERTELGRATAIKLCFVIKVDFVSQPFCFSKVLRLSKGYKRNKKKYKVAHCF